MKTKLYFFALLLCLAVQGVWAQGTLDRTRWTVTAQNETPNEGTSPNGTLNGPARCIIDDDLTSYWHSDWTGNQVGKNLPQAFMIDCAEEVTFMGFGYYPRPNQGNGTMTAYKVYVSNTAFDLTNLPTEGEAMSGTFTWPGGASYNQAAFANAPMTGRYVLVVSTASKTDTYFTCADFNLYTSEAGYEKDNLAKAIQTASALVGENPGYFPQARIDAAQAVYDNASATIEEVRQATQQISTPIMPVEGKTYLLVSAYPEYNRLQGVEKAIYYDAEYAKWKTLNLADPTFYWYITPNANGTYSIRSMSNDNLYAQQIADNKVHFAETAADITLTSLGSGQFNIQANGTFHTEGHNSGSGSNGPIVAWGGAANTASSWYIREAELKTGVTFNYIYTLDDKSKTVVVEGVVGEDFPVLSGLPHGTTAERPTGKVAANQPDVTITLDTSSYPVQYAATAGAITQWYTMNVHSNEAPYMVYGDATAPKVENSPAYDEVGLLKSDFYAWGFVGDPIDGFKVYNKGAQAAMVQPSDADVQITFGEGDVFVLGATTSGIANSFSLKVDGRRYYVNHRGTKIQGWTESDGGSSFCVQEIDFEAQEVLKAQANFTAFDAALEKAQSFAALLGDGVGQYRDDDEQLLDYVADAEAMAANKENYTGADQARIDELTLDLTTAVANLNINQPTRGKYYRLQSVNSGRYLTQSGDAAVLSADESNSNVFLLTSDGKLQSIVNEEYVVCASEANYTPVTLSATAAEGTVFSFLKSDKAGAYGIMNGNIYLLGWDFGNIATTLVGDGDNIARKQWVITEVEIVDLTDLKRQEALAAIDNAPALYTQAQKDAARAAVEAAATKEAIAAAMDEFYPLANGDYSIYTVGRNPEKNYLTIDEENHLLASEGKSGSEKVWTIESTGAFTFSIRNRQTGEYIQANPGRSNKFITGENPASLTIAPATVTADASDMTIGTSGYNFLHEADYHGVVGWEANNSSSAWFFESADAVFLTYIYKNGETEWYRQEAIALESGAEYPDLYPQPAGVKYLNVPTGKVLRSEEYVINCEYDGKNPITRFSDSYEDAVWTYLSIHDDNYHLRYVAGQAYISVTGTTRPSATDYSYQWAFVGNPFTGYKIVNRAAGADKILTSPAVTGEGGETYPVMMSIQGLDTEVYNTYWKVTNYAPGIAIARQGENANMNRRGSKLAFWTSKDGGSRIGVEQVDLSFATVNNLATDKTYNIVNRATGNVLGHNGTAYTTGSLDASADAQRWTVSFSGNTLRLTNAATGAISTNYYLCSAADGYYYITNSTNTASGQSERVALSDTGNGTMMYTTWLPYSQWQFVEAAAPNSAQILTPAELKTGHYYRIVNDQASTTALFETSGRVRGTSVSEHLASQVWKLTQTGSKWSFQNLATDNYIATSNSQNVNNPYPTGTTATSFTIGAVRDSVFYISEGTVANNGLNLNTAYNSVVNWQYNDDRGSHWRIYEVLNIDELRSQAELYAEASSLTNAQLSTYFADNACTTLRSPYSTMSADELRAAMASMPTVIQDMAVKVRENKWNDDATYSQYEKGFRIADYEIYTTNSWSSIVGVGPFSKLFNPTGIAVKAGEIFYIFANSGPRDSDAQLRAHIASSTNSWDSQEITLHEGVNVIQATADGEVMIDYQLNNVVNGAWNNKVVGQYPDIKVHIEGGECTGMWDMHRGMTNNQWAWLRSNMFTNKYLHVKGNSVMLSVQTQDVMPENDPTTVMKIWDFVFDTEESLVDCDKYRRTGAYKPMINSRNSFSGAPNWGGQYGTNHPGLSYNSGEFNSDALVHTGHEGGNMWVLEHEIGHAHQYPVRVAGSTESSNNGLAQIVNHLWGYRSSRGEGVYDALRLFNAGYTWVDYMRAMNHRACTEYGTALWMSNHMFFQLWLYFDYLGNYQPSDGTPNDGFAFFSRLSSLIRERGGIRTSWKADDPGNYKNDYMLFARSAADAAETDLSEFFEMWGIFRYADETKVINIPANDGSGDENVKDNPANGVYYIGDYGSYYIKMPMRTNAEDVAYVDSVYNAMKAYTKKAPELMFLNDVARDMPIRDDAEVLKYDPSVAGQTVGYYRNNFAGTQGQMGLYIDYGKDQVTTSTTISIVDKYIIVDGDALVGIKIYDADGKLTYVSNEYGFSVSSDIAQGLNDGTYSIYGVSGDGYEINLLDPEYENDVMSIGKVCRTIHKALNGDTTITVDIIRGMVDELLEIQK